MTERRVAFVVAGDVVTIVDTETPDNADDPITILADDTWKLQRGDRAEAYEVMSRRCINYLRENDVDSAVVKASALTMGSTKLAHLHSAELRGVVIAAAASVTPVRTVAKSLVSRTYGDRKVDEYVDDDDFWDEHTTGGRLRKSSREAAMIVIATRGK
jgi:hypothetical protein